MCGHIKFKASVLEKIFVEVGNTQEAVTDAELLSNK